MTQQLMSEQIKAAIAKLDATPHPTPDQIAEWRKVYRELLEQLGDFAQDFEQAKRTVHTRAYPLWGGAGAAARLYRWLECGRRRPTVGMGETVVAIARQATAQ